MRIGSWIGLLAAVYSRLRRFLAGTKQHCRQLYALSESHQRRHSLGFHQRHIDDHRHPGQFFNRHGHTLLHGHDGAHQPYLPGDLRTQCIFADLQQRDGANLHADRNLNQFDDQRNL